MKPLLHRLLELFFPGTCLSCGRTPGPQFHHLCPECAQRIRLLADTVPGCCEICSKPLLFSALNRCYSCDQDPDPLVRNISLYSYQDPLCRLLFLHYKAGGFKATGRDLARIWQPALLSAVQSIQPDLITAVPLSRKSLRRRGFNQTGLLLDYCTVPHSNILGRRNHTQAQKKLGYRDRRQEISGQFYAEPSALKRIKGSHILLIDDIYTTGATVRECAGVLLDQGAAWVSALTFLRS